MRVSRGVQRGLEVISAARSGWWIVSVDGTQDFALGFTELVCVKECDENAACVEGVCTCRPGFTGTGTAQGGCVRTVWEGAGTTISFLAPEAPLGWRVGSVELHGTEDCSANPLTGQAAAKLGQPPQHTRKKTGILHCDFSKRTSEGEG